MRQIYEQLILLFAFMLAGYLLGWRGCRSKLLSTIEVDLFLPCTAFNAFASGFHRDYLWENYSLILISTAILAVLAVGGYFAARLFSRHDYTRRVYHYSLTIPNYGYMGYALAEGLFGAAGLLDAMLFALPMSFYIYTYAYCSLTGQRFRLKQLINPTIIALLLGAVVGFFGIRLPNVVQLFTSKGAACMAPVSMLLAGMTIAEYDLRSLVSDKRIYLVSALRLLVIPLALIGVLRLLHCSQTVIRTAGLLYAMPCGLNTIVFARFADEDCSTGAKMAFVSNLLAMLTVPLCLYFI